MPTYTYNLFNAEFPHNMVFVLNAESKELKHDMSYDIFARTETNILKFETNLTTP